MLKQDLSKPGQDDDDRYDDSDDSAPRPAQTAQTTTNTHTRINGAQQPPNSYSHDKLMSRAMLRVVSDEDPAINKLDTG